jgi:EAL domain-containing protein (putative c-di-GMP-specific phosphodiesterase class I)
MDGMAAQANPGRADPPDLGADLAAALAAGGGGLRLDLQPICAAASLAPVGYEALLRWDHPAHGPIPARDIFTTAAAIGRGVALDAWAIVGAFRLRAGWPAGGPYLSVNISPAGLLQGYAGPMVRAALAATGADPRGIVLELPEAAVVADLAAAAALAGELRSLGIAVSLDDFGGAAGSARALRDIPFAVVKLDPALTGGLAEEGTDRARTTVASEVEMAHALGATTVAEAVETAAQMRVLRDAGCDALQGWLLGRPGPVAA